MVGQRPYAAFGGSDGDTQMLGYTKAGDGARLAKRGLCTRAQADGSDAIRSAI